MTLVQQVDPHTLHGRYTIVDNAAGKLLHDRTWMEETVQVGLPVTIGIVTRTLPYVDASISITGLQLGEEEDTYIGHVSDVAVTLYVGAPSTIDFPERSFLAA